MNNKFIATVTINKDGYSLTGYLKSDNTFEFLLDGELQSFDSLTEVCAQWEMTLGK